MRRAAATHADRMHLGDIFGNRQQRRHGAERAAHVILIQPGGDDANTGVGQFHAEVDDGVVEELHFVNADDLDAKLEMYVRCLSRDQATGPFTDRDPVLGRQLYKGRSV